MTAVTRIGALLLPIFVIMVATSTARAEGDGGHNGGGGDSCEDRFKAVASDLRQWIQAGGAVGLDLAMNASLTTDSYAARMLEKISGARIACVSPGDPGYPVLVNGRPKECRSGADAQGILRIECDRTKFYSSLADPDNNPGQYRIVHHEYATLAGLEVPNQDDSDYHLSDQISGFLESQIVKRLVVRKPVSSQLTNSDKLVTVFVSTLGQAFKTTVARVYARQTIEHNPLCTDSTVTRVNKNYVKKDGIYLQADCTDEGLRLFTFIQCEGEHDENCKEVANRGPRTVYEIAAAMSSVQWLKPSDAILYTTWADALPETRGFFSEYGSQLLDLLNGKSNTAEIVTNTSGPVDRMVYEQMLYYSYDSRCSRFGVLQSCSWGEKRK